MTRKYSATFPDGTVLKRESDRIYSHAWRRVFQVEGGGTRYPRHGFSASRELAVKGAESCRPRYAEDRVEIVEVTFVEKKTRSAA